MPEPLAPVVSVCMVTYNHAPFVAEAIDGVLKQKTPFAIELVIGEDCSTDGTRAICERYAARFPSIIRLLPTIGNLGMNQNAIRTLGACRGQFIALCEGDDFWTDPQKLCLQYEALARDTEAAGVFHDCWIVDSERGHTRVDIGTRSIDRRPDLRSLIREKNFRTASMLFRNRGSWETAPGWFSQAEKQDYALALLMALNGPWLYIDRPMAVYRQHPGGVWSNRPWRRRMEAGERFFEGLLHEPGFEGVGDVLRVRIALAQIGLASLDAREGLTGHGIRRFVRSWAVCQVPHRARLLRRFILAIVSGVRPRGNAVSARRASPVEEVEVDFPSGVPPEAEIRRLSPGARVRAWIGRNLYSVVHQAVHNAMNEERHDIQAELQRRALQETTDFVWRSIPMERFFESRYLLLDECVRQASHHGLHLEFGVYLGRTLNYLADRRPSVTFYGFDSFEGLREPWRCSRPGKFDLRGEMPSVRSNVRLIKGWFEESLPAFLSRHGDACSFVHVDSDLYSSAKTVLNLLTPYFMAGTILVFDEFFNYPGWQDGEYRAFSEWVREHNVRFEFIGCTTRRSPDGRSTGEQVAVRITGIGLSQG